MNRLLDLMGEYITKEKCCCKGCYTLKEELELLLQHDTLITQFINCLENAIIKDEEKIYEFDHLPYCYKYILYKKEKSIYIEYIDIYEDSKCEYVVDISNIEKKLLCLIKDIQNRIGV